MQLLFLTTCQNKQILFIKRNDQASLKCSYRSKIFLTKKPIGEIDFF